MAGWWSEDDDGGLVRADLTLLGGRISMSSAGPIWAPRGHAQIVISARWAQLGLPCLEPAPVVASDLLADPLAGAPVGGLLRTRRCSVMVGASWAHGV
jgi:hypothetical protein